MSGVVIRGEGISKRYLLGAGIQGRLTETVWSAVERRVRRSAGNARRDLVWALQDVSFEVADGEVVGFIGRNGAGKSTLLKILSRITEPTAGYVDIRGRVGSLLEVGSGFHQDLTGRENVFLYGAVLGMRKREVEKKFDEIVAFAEIEKFIDTPVKRYSSGMYVRLAFAVAAHLEPDILIVDEVLAVGDFAFQQKCLGKMEQTASGGRTVLFVSHNTGAVAALCHTAHLLDHGRIVASGPAADVARQYLEGFQRSESIPLHERTDRTGDGSIRIMSVQVENADGGAISSSSRLRVTLTYESARELLVPAFLVTIHDADYRGVFRLDTHAEGDLPQVLPARGTLTCITDPIRLTPGRCMLKVAAWRGSTMADQVEFAGRFDVHPDDFYPSGRMPSRSSVVALIHHQWSFADGDGAA
jgi:homopolymeric O-antigen transport system ATP-binding protein